MGTSSFFGLSVSAHLTCSGADLWISGSFLCRNGAAHFALAFSDRPSRGFAAVVASRQPKAPQQRKDKKWTFVGSHDLSDSNAEAAELSPAEARLLTQPR